ncbi:Pls/PosA family non-ribosomal peptide synthetase [Pseudarthrobacter sp. J75]|uniref:Pls/PosA family non-ribosomal peptide synthetase n=1 Tax=unclassified Pseudarthrobacter TaxID=2647000 RepID=UPI002E8088AA|nr:MULTISPECIES: Pls/PosA family non-ribosomal peptide synthetase [unclassified Pseudarthrobacter]MEE2521867.1 Pls/PosA family non-ribosomal peptide synthetase [Pseudarthrobacter sp. J47]MEE2527944.1 Pls/PosA family non-ribosomal peptide synthetase [Pseudarthrobacter sp. J75]
MIENLAGTTAPRPQVYLPQLPGAGAAPPQRTLVDILEETAAANPEASALDDGTTSLSYSQLLAEVRAMGRRLHHAGLGAGDKIGVRVPSGTNELYVAILAILLVGAAYVPVDADDPEERARLVFGEAKVAAVVGPASSITMAAERPRPFPAPRTAKADDDAWVIFTSGSTGTPKGVAVQHRSAAAFVDAEARIFLSSDPLGPQDRVLAGLSVAFDASCEEMWLAWRHGACLVPAPRALVRTGMDLGPWLINHGITVVSTVPTLAALWPAESLENVRLLIFGGEACPPELAERLAVEGREVWNTYGPTEATVVACAAPLGGPGPVRIGLPLDGWDLAVVDSDGVPVAEGAIGELIIGGVGLARYLDPAKDAEKYAPMPSLGWERAYRSGDLVRFEAEGLVFMGRADEQVKLGGRRIELGEIDAALQSLPNVAGAAAAVQTTAAGNQILVGYLAPAGTAHLDLTEARALLAASLPAPLIPLLAVVDSLPTKTSGKVDRHALPWPLAGAAAADADAAPLNLPEDAHWIVERWSSVLGSPVTTLDADFFAYGGGSLAAAQLVSALRVRYPSITVAEIYATPRVGALIDTARQSLPDGVTAAPAAQRSVRPTAFKSQLFQTLMGIPLHILVGMRWLTYLMVANNLLSAFAGFHQAPTVSWWWLAASWLVFVSPAGRMAISIAAARILLRDVVPGRYPRSGKVHLRLWLAEQIQDLAGAVSLASAPWVPSYARALGAKIGNDVQLHSLPPVTGFLSLGHGANIEPEVDLSGWWIDGDHVHIGRVHVGAGATVGARSTLMPGASIGAGASVDAGSAVLGKVKAGQSVAGSPAERRGKAKRDWPDAPVVGKAKERLWFSAFAAASAVLSLIPYLSAAAAAAVVFLFIRGSSSLAAALPGVFAALPLAALVWFLANMLLVLGTTRLLSIGLATGYYRVRSRIGWQVWATERVLDLARDLLFPIYASLFTPVWLRLLGARIGKNVEASTVLLLPKMTTVGDGAFLADDTMVASYELGGGWMKIAPAKIGKRSFLGNSGMTAAGRNVPKNSLVAVLSATPTKAKSGSSWLGSPPVRLRRTAVASDSSLTYKPPTKLKVARSLWELCRFVPVVLTVAIAAGVMLAADAIAATAGYWAAAALGGIVMLLAGGVAAGSAVVAKWLLVGRIRAGEHPLWSQFIWRNEVVDTFIEMVSAPWFARAAAGTPALVWWLRSLGAKIGSGAWCESYWLPEADLVTLGKNSTVNRGCVVQTHLFHDRIMNLDTVHLEDGATMGPHGVILPQASIGSGGTVGPASLVMRGEHVPAGTYWMGNPVSPWKGPVLPAPED